MGEGMKPGDPVRHRRSADPGRLGEVIKDRHYDVYVRWSWDNGETWPITLLLLAHEVLPDDRPRTEAQRAPRWAHWLDGMADTFGDRYGDGDGRGLWAIGRYPDIDDGPTKGALLQLARYRHGPACQVSPIVGKAGTIGGWTWYLNDVANPNGETKGGVYESEGLAHVGLLEWPS